MNETIATLIGTGIKVVESQYINEPTLLLPKGFMEEVQKRNITIEEMLKNFKQSL